MNRKASLSDEEIPDCYHDRHFTDIPFISPLSDGRRDLPLLHSADEFLSVRFNVGGTRRVESLGLSAPGTSVSYLRDLRC